MRQVAKRTRENRTITVDFQDETTYVQLRSDGTAFGELVLAFLLSWGFQLKHKATRGGGGCLSRHSHYARVRLGGVSIWRWFCRKFPLSINSRLHDATGSGQVHLHYPQRTGTRPILANALQCLRLRPWWHTEQPHLPQRPDVIRQSCCDGRCTRPPFPGGACMATIVALLHTARHCATVTPQRECVASPHRSWYHQKRLRVSVFSLQGVRAYVAYRHTAYLDPVPRPAGHARHF